MVTNGDERRRKMDNPSKYYHSNTQQKKKKTFPKWIKTTALTIVFAGSLIVTTGSFYVREVIKDTPPVTKDALISTPSTNIYAQNGDVIWSSSDNFRVYVPFEDIPKDYIDLLLSVEDYEFYQNPGFNPKGFINASLSYIRSFLGDDSVQVRGGSSIEQQLIKLSVFSTGLEDITVNRKIKELFLSNQLYENYSKDEILEFYINKIYLGQNAYGAGTISQTYYGKPLNELNLSQLAIIAGLGQAPSENDLYKNPEAVKHRRDTVLELAYNRNEITQEEYHTAINTDVEEGLKPKGWINEQNDQLTVYYSDYIDSTIKQLDSMGYDLNQIDLQIHTYLDTTIYQHIKEIWDQENSPYFQNNDQQAAITITDPRNGAVLTQLGGRFTQEAFGFNRATNRNRSTGSSTKPFVVASAFEYLNWDNDHSVDTDNYTYDGTQTIARNYGGSEYGNQPISTSLAQSYNTPMLRTLETVGTTYYQQLLESMGYQFQEPLNLTHALGVDASTADLAGSLSALSQYGIYHPPLYIKSITFPDGSTKQMNTNGERVLLQDTAYRITDILQSVVSPGGMFEQGHIPDLEVAVKTGTVAYPENNDVDHDNEAMDMWMAAYTKTRAVAIWQGYDEPFEEGGQLNERDLYDKKAELFKNIMTHIATEEDYTPWQAPDTVYTKENGALASNATLNVLDKPVIDIEQTLYNLFLGSENKSYNLRVTNPDFQQVPEGYTIGEWKENFEQIKDLQLEQAQNRLDNDLTIREENEARDTQTLEERFGLPRLSEPDEQGIIWRELQ